MFEIQPSLWIKIEMNSTAIIGYGWHHISVISLHEAVELYWHRLNTLNGVSWNICRGYILQFKINVKQCLSISIGKKKIYICGIDIAWIFFITSHIWYILSVGWQLSLRTVDHRDLSEYHSNNLKFHASFCHLTWSECPRAYCRLFVYLFVKLN
jgi:hypothetical protein